MASRVEDALKHRAVLLSGTEDVLRLRALEEIIARATGGEEFDLQVFVAGDGDPAEWAGSASTAPFLGERRTVVVRNVLREDEPAEVFGEKGERLASLPDSGLLVFVADDELGDDTKQRKLESVRRAWESVIKKGGGLVLSFDFKDSEVQGELRAEAKRLGKTLTPRAAATLWEMVGGNLSRGFEELEKIAIYVGPEAQIGEADVKAVAVPSREWSVFKLVDAIFERRVHEALHQLRILVGSTSKAEDAAFSRILPTLDRQLRLVWQARICVEARASPAQAPESVSSLFPENVNLAAQKDWSQNKAMRQARQIGLEQICGCFEAIRDADAALKGMRPGFSAIDTLEQMVLTMAGSVGR